jgi:hypothetical protein
MEGEIDVSPFTNPQTGSFRSFIAESVPIFELLLKSPRIDNHAISKNKLTFWIGDATGQMVQFQCAVSDDNRMSGIVTALKSSHPTDFTGELVNHLAFALVTPLSAEHHRGGHDCRALPAIDELAH